MYRSQLSRLQSPKQKGKGAWSASELTDAIVEGEISRLKLSDFQLSSRLEDTKEELTATELAEKCQRLKHEKGLIEEELNHVKESSKSKIQELEEKIVQITDEYEATNKLLQNRNRRLEILIAKLHKASASSKIEELMDSFSEERKEYETKIDQLQSEITRLKSINQKYHESSDPQNQELLDKLTSDNKQMKKIITHLTALLKQKRKKKDEQPKTSEESSDEFKSIKEKNRSMVQTISMLSEQIRTLQKENEANNSKIRVLDSINSRQNIELIELTAQKAFFDDEKSELLTKIKNLETKIELSEQDHQRSINAIRDSSSNVILYLKREKEALEKEIESLKNLSQ